MRIRKPNMKPIPEDLAKDYQVLDGGALWHASKNHSYRDSITDKLDSIHQFLEAKGMYTSEDVEVVRSEDFKIRRDQLTDTGFLFVWRYLHGYLESLERTERTSNSDYLDACFDHFSGAR